MWACPKCGESIEEAFAVCWSCGTGRDGTEDPTFRGEDSVPAPSEEETALPSRVVWTGYRVIGVVGAGFIGFFVPIVLKDVPHPLQPESHESVGIGTWLAGLAFAFFVWPVIVVLWLAYARVFGYRLEWSKPRWSRSPLEFSRPLDLLHFAMWAHFVGGLAMLLALPAVGSGLFPQICALLVCAVSLWVTMKCLMKIHVCDPPNSIRADSRDSRAYRL